MVKLECQSGGGILLVDRDNLAKWRESPPFTDADFSEVLSIAVDAEGKTDQVFSWEEEKWSDVWRRETLPLSTLANDGDLSVVVFRRGIYYCDIEILADSTKATECVKLEQKIFVPSGVIVIADLGKIAEDWEVAFPVEYDNFKSVEVDVSKGWHKVTYFFPTLCSVSGNGRHRVFGSAGEPACLIRLEPSNEKRTIVGELPVFPFDV